MEFKERLQYLRLEKNISEKELSDKTGVTESVIRLYEKGKLNIDLDHLKQLADFFQVSPKLLLGSTFPDLSPEEAVSSFRAVQELVEIRGKEKQDEDNLPDSPLQEAEIAPAAESSSNESDATVWQTLKSGTVALFDQIKAGVGPEDQEVESYWPVYNSITSLYGNDLNNYYYLRVYGNSMEPTIKDQGIVLVKTNLTVQNKDLVVVLCKHDEAARVKRITRYNNKVILLSDNTAYPAQVYNEPDCTVLGKVLWKTTTLQNHY